jgi:hypothetical protein
MISGKSIGNRSRLAVADTPSEAVNEEQRPAFAAIDIMQVNAVYVSDVAGRQWLRPSC